MSEKKVTIITPVKNILDKQLAERFLNCVSSVANQTYPSIEHLVIDGNSDDGTAVILTTQPPIRCEFCSSETKEEAMNYGLSKAEGDYILFLNAGDCLLEDTAIEKMVKTLEENDADFVYGPSIYENPMGTKRQEDTEILHFFIGLGFQLQTCLFKKEIFNKIGDFNTSLKLCAANEFIVKMFINGFCGMSYKVPLVLFFTKFVFLGKEEKKKKEKKKEETIAFLKIFYKDFPAYTEQKINDLIKKGSMDVELYEQLLEKVAAPIRKELYAELKKLSDAENYWVDLVKKGYKQVYVLLPGVGDAVIFQAVAKGLFEKTGHKVLVGHRNKELFENNPYVDVTKAIHKDIVSSALIEKIEDAGLKVIFPSYWVIKKSFDGKYDCFYPDCHLIAQMAVDCGLDCKIDLKPVLFLSEEEKKYGRYAPEGKKQVAIMSGAQEKYKFWPYFQEVVDALKNEFYFVQIGAKSDKALEGVSRAVNGEISLRQTASVLYNSDLFVGEIGGLMHMARAVDCPAVIAYSSVEPDYFVNYIANTNVYPKDECHESYDWGIQGACNACLNRFKCVRSIDVKEVVQAIRDKLKNPASRPLPVETIQVKPADLKTF